jgi:TRAP-type C4-dicarboxylate transport system permease small subunit
MTEEPAGISARISRYTRWFACAGLMVMTAIIGWQVFARYVLNASPAWAEQAALLLMIWYVLFAAAAGVREGFHIRIAVFETALAPGAQKTVRIAGHLLVGLFGLAMVVWGTELTLATWQHDIPTLGLPRGVAYAPMPLSGMLIVGFSIEHVLALWRGQDVDGTWN